MNRNVESRFSLAPNINIPRSINDSSFDHKTSFDVGQLIPLMWDEILPGQSMKLTLHSALRMQPMVSCPLQDLYLDTFAFFIPNRLVWSHWKEFMGENTTAPWVQTTEYNVPQLINYQGNYPVLPGSILDYLGVPVNQIMSDAPRAALSFSSLPIRAYCLCVREFFQDQNLETPVNVPLDDSDRYYLNKSDSANFYNPMYMHQGGMPYIVNRYHDYFSSCTPGPTKSSSDILAFPNMPVITQDVDNSDSISYALRWNYGVEDETHPIYDHARINGDFISAFDPNDTSHVYSSMQGIAPINLQAISGVTINDLRNAFAVQRLLERDLYGTKYREMLKAHFGVTSPDASLQVPQYLGGKRMPLRISQILQTSETSNTPQGNVAGYSLTSDSDYLFDHSFTEHGIVMVLGCVRYKNTFQNGLNKKWSRKTRFDYYFPEMAALGNMPVFKKELFADGSSADDEVFGYNEAWAEYRYHPDMLTGLMRSNVDNSLDVWHFGDDYISHPSLSREWMKVDKGNVDRVLAVSSEISNQLYGDFEFQIINTLPMPLYSIPGLNGTF